jgi:hypothetical protein
VLKYSINTPLAKIKKGKPECKTKVKTEKLESGVPVPRVCEEYGAKKQAVSDIRKTRYTTKFVLMCDVEWMLQISQQNMKMV